MNIGMLKLNRIIFISIVIIGVVFTSCSTKTSIQYKEKIKPKKKIEIKSIDIKQTNNIIKKENNKPIAIPIKKEKIKIINIEDSNSVLKRSSKLDDVNLDEFKFDFIKKGIQDNNTFLIVGGIQGDEPGGFMAASLFSTHYKIVKGSVWVVPNLNFYSIIKRSRGPYGDMNRKFAKLSKKDPEYKILQRIKKYIKAPEVSLVLNLHDGSGFYRFEYINKNHQPLKWGQSLVIDQEILPNVKKYANTYDISEKVINHINKHLINKEHKYRTKNTHTRFKKTHEETEMAKTLTYYAVTHGKSAFGHETSKSLTVSQRVYYKLLAIEKYMDIMGIEYKRNFPLTVKGIKKALNDDISIKFNGTNINLPLKDIRNIQKYFPINKDGIIKYLPSNPLIKIIKTNNIYTIYYGNRRLTKLQADYTKHLNFNTSIKFIIDNKKKDVKFGDTIEVSKSFLIKQNNKFRVNVIGYRSPTGVETEIFIRKNEFIQKYSIEKKGNLFRIEFYKDNKFVGMILVKFIK
jgi:hypothetical protein